MNPFKLSRKHNFFQTRTPVKGSRVDILHTVRDHNAPQAVTILKSTYTQHRQSGRQLNRFQVGTINKRIRADKGHRFCDRYGFQIGMLRKSICTNTGNAFMHDHMLDFLDVVRPMLDNFIVKSVHIIIRHICPACNFQRLGFRVIPP